MKLFFKHFLCGVICLLLGSCATPSSPTGGPQDKTGPDITSSEPETSTVNFDGDTIILHFSEFVERASLEESLVIEPELGLKYDLDWGRKSVAITFDRKIPDSTTLIVTVGTDFSDVHGNSISKPFKVAVSTGPKIDKGTLAGRVLDAQTGEGSKAERVLLYRRPVDLTQPANYIAETDTSGTVQFSYLRQGTYKAFWVDDRNRNRVWEPQRERAQPFKQDTVILNEAEDDSLGTLFIANSDTTKPKLQGVGLFSSKRLRLRFSENINFTDSTSLAVTDSSGKPFSKPFKLYVSPATKYVLFAQSNKAFQPEASYKLLVKNMADVAGNVQPVSSQTFTGSAQKDTTAQRIIGTSVGEGIFPDDPVEIIYAKPISKASVRDSIKVVKGDSVLQRWSQLQINQNKLRILPGGTWEEGVDYEFRVWNPVQQNVRSVKPTIWYGSSLGKLHITYKDSTGTAARRPTKLQLKNKQGNIVADTTFSGEITLDHLAPVKHQLRLYQDLNKNGTWDFGTIDPFKSPEPYFIQNDIPVQQGFTSDLYVTFK